jgi:hypothetical protein
MFGQFLTLSNDEFFMVDGNEVLESDWLKF